MNSYPGKSTKTLWLLLWCGILVGACGGGAGGGSSESAGVGGTGINVAKGVVVGEVTGFGSIYVNGIKFNTASSSFLVDGNPDASQGDLAVGMVVTLEVELSDGVYTGKALGVVYDDEVQGPVAAAPVDVAGSGGQKKTFEVFGQTVTIDRIDTVFENTGFDTLAALAAEKERFDVVVIDPPAFIKRKKDHAKGLAAYRKLNQQAMRLVARDGFLVTCSCSYHLAAEELTDAVQRSARHLDRLAQVVEFRGQAPDHPVHPAIAETRYLKTLICRITGD